MTSKPFGCNLTILPTINPPPYLEYAQAIIDEGVTIVETAGLVKDVVAMFKARGIIVLHKCTTIRHAQSGAKMGVDFLSIDGFECAGHPGETDIPNFILLSLARQTLKTPFIASGGFADGYGLAGAMALGACGINMGTRFLCTVEAPVHQNIKQSIVDASEMDTQLVMRRYDLPCSHLIRVTTLDNDVLTIIVDGRTQRATSATKSPRPPRRSRRRVPRASSRRSRTMSAGSADGRSSSTGIRTTAFGLQGCVLGSSRISRRARS